MSGFSGSDRRQELIEVIHRVRNRWRMRLALHGVVIVGSIIVMLNTDPGNILLLSLGFIAVILGTLNVVGGFVVTDRMLEMFRKKPGSNK